ncbi:MAG TPA: aspartate carbamoyltransferase regulatory subunit [archaeon]|nr:aspartate carbamoyltransferase regulatory subunit [archaeon]
MKKEIRITPIKKGTAIDHLNAGSAYKLLEVLDLKDLTLTLGINVESRKMGRKDIIFIEGRELSQKEMDKIALIGKGATLNIIKNSEIVNKTELSYPQKVEGIMRCINPKCITNAEKITSKFLISKNPLQAQCFYCEIKFGDKEIAEAVKK